MKDSLKLFFEIISMRIKGQAQYPVNMLIGIIQQGFLILVEIFGIWILFARFKSVAGWSFHEIFISYGILLFSFSISDMLTYGLEANMSNLIKQGTYDRYLVRPRNTIMQICAFDFKFIKCGRVFSSFIVIIIGAYLCRYEITGIKEWCVLIFAIVGGCLLFIGMSILVGAITFKTVERPECVNILVYGSTSTMQYPIIIYPAWLRVLFTFIFPVACVTYFPIAAVLGKPIGIPVTFAYFTPVFCFLFFYIAILIFRKVERTYISTGKLKNKGRQMSFIEVNNISKTYKVAQYKHRGVLNSILNMFNRKFIEVNAVNNIHFQ